MIPFRLAARAVRGSTVLCLGAHSDDIEIGCGGTILTWLNHQPDTDVHWIVFTAAGEREREARRSADRFLKGARSHHVTVLQFRESYFPYEAAAIKDAFGELQRTIAPDVVFTHYRDDRHQDHRVISDLTWNTFRNHLVLEYEIPKFDGDLGQPNCFVPLSPGIRRRKLALISRAFRTQAEKHWFGDDTFNGLMRLRGMEAAHAGYAEAFYARKLTWTFDAPRPSRSGRRRG